MSEKMGTPMEENLDQKLPQSPEQQYRHPENVEALEEILKEKVQHFIASYPIEMSTETVMRDLKEKFSDNEYWPKNTAAFYLGRLRFINELVGTCYGFYQSEYSSLSDENRKKYGEISSRVYGLQKLYEMAFAEAEDKKEINAGTIQELNDKWGKLLSFADAH